MHTCSDCGQACCCSGDIDDIDFGEWEGCIHYRVGECNNPEDWIDVECDDDGTADDEAAKESGK